MWYIESHVDEPFALADIAAATGISPFHLSRLFQARTGVSVMRHVRGRRLTVAAQRLAEGACDILQVALSAGYSTHAAFTRAFSEQFGRTPERVRTCGLRGMPLVYPLRLNQTSVPCTAAPRLLESSAFEVAGIRVRYASGGVGAIPGQWQQLNREWSAPTPLSYGVCCNVGEDGGFDYVAGLPMTVALSIPRHWQRVAIPARRYLVAWHAGHVSSIRSTWLWLIDQYLPASRFGLAAGPELERYDMRFEDQSGHGGVEIWLPVDDLLTS